MHSTKGYLVSVMLYKDMVQHKLLAFFFQDHFYYYLNYSYCYLYFLFISFLFQCLQG